MSPFDRRVVLTFATSGLLLLGAAAAEVTPELLARLGAMPAEARRDAAAELDAFRRLPADEQQQIRSIESYLAQRPEEDRARLRDEISGYAAWYASLAELDRAKLEAAATDAAWLVEVRKLRDRPGRLAGGRGELTPEQRVARHLAEVGEFSLVQETTLLLGWRSLPEAERKRLPDPARQREDFRRALARAGRKAMAEPAADSPAGRLARRLDEVREEARKGMARRPELADIKNRGELARRGLASALRAAEVRALYTDRLPVVKSERLEKFWLELPAWSREAFLPLPPETARAALAIMYREVFPEGMEIPEPTKSEAAPKKATPPPPIAPGTAF